MSRMRILKDSGDFRVLRMRCEYGLASRIGEYIAVDVACASCRSGVYHVRMPTKTAVYKFIAMDLT
jgi:hypothetical protein